MHSGYLYTIHRPSDPTASTPKQLLYSCEWSWMGETGTYSTLPASPEHPRNIACADGPGKGTGGA